MKEQTTEAYCVRTKEIIKICRNISKKGKDKHNKCPCFLSISKKKTKKSNECTRIRCKKLKLPVKKLTLKIIRQNAGDNLCIFCQCLGKYLSLAWEGYFCKEEPGADLCEIEADICEAVRCLRSDWFNFKNYLVHKCKNMSWKDIRNTTIDIICKVCHCLARCVGQTLRCVFNMQSVHGALADTCESVRYLSSQCYKSVKCMLNSFCECTK